MLRLIGLHPLALPALLFWAQRCIAWPFASSATADSDEKAIVSPDQENVTETLKRLLKPLERRIGDLQEEVRSLRQEQQACCRGQERGAEGGVHEVSAQASEAESPEDDAGSAEMALLDESRGSRRREEELSDDTIVNEADLGDDKDGIVSIDVANTDWLKEVLFGGRPWILYCDDKKQGLSDHYLPHMQLPAVFQESASQLKGIASFGKLDCWQRTASGKTLAHRFDFPEPPVMFAVANGDPPMVLDLEGLSKPWQLRRKVQPYLSASVVRIDSPETFKSNCTARRACLVVGFKNAKMLSETLSVLQPVLQEHRGVRAVSVDTSVWKVKLDDKFAATRPKKKDGQKERSYIVCIGRRAGSQSQGAFFRLTGDEEPTAENLEVFLDRCNSQKNLVGMKDAPRISLRPPDQPKQVKPKESSPATSPSPPAPLYERHGKASPTPPAPLYERHGKAPVKGKTDSATGTGAKKRAMPRYSSSGEDKHKKGKAFTTGRGFQRAAGKKQDKVGSRKSLEEDEPLFEAVEDPPDDGETPVDVDDEPSGDDSEEDEDLVEL